MEAKRKHIIYKEEFRRQAGEMVIHSGKTQAQVARELGCSEYSLNLWKKAYLRQQAPTEIDGEQRSPEQMFAEIRRLQKENEYLKRQREILSIKNPIVTSLRAVATTAMLKFFRLWIRLAAWGK
jgi:transposase-like protein